MAMRLRDVRLEEERESDPRNLILKEIPRQDVTMIWAAGYFDGPTEGLASFEKRDLWFTLSNCWYYGIDKIYWLVELLPDQATSAKENHAAFQRLVGTHHDLLGGSVPWVAGESSQREYFQQYKDWELRLDDNQVVGWFSVGGVMR